MRFVSVGEICAPAYYLREVGARDVAYPFDWCHSSAPILERCVADRFSTFLDRSRIRPAEGGGSRHDLFHESFFRHKDAHTDEGHAYYRRAVGRFLELLDGSEPVTFVAMLADPDIHRDWRAGFFAGAEPTYTRFRQTLEWWQARCALGILHRPNVRVATIILQRWTRSSFQVGGENSLHGFLTIQGNGGSPFEHPADHAAALDLFREIVAR